MIAKGTQHDNGSKLADYLTKGKHGETAELWELRGFAAEDIKEAFRSIHVMAEATKAEQPFFHVQVRLPEGEKLTREQWEHCAARIERMLKLKDQPRAIAFHIDKETGEEHMHVAWSRIDAETMKAIPLPFYKERLKKICRELEQEFGITQVKNERDSKIDYAPTRNEDEQARRLGVDVHKIRETIRGCFDRSDCGRAFEAALAQEGMILAKGDRRDYLVIDQEGGMYALGKKLLEVTAAQVRNKLADLDRAQLPTLEQARERQLARELAKVQKQIEAAPPQPEQKAPQKEPPQQRPQQQPNPFVAQMIAELRERYTRVSTLCDRYINDFELYKTEWPGLHEREPHIAQEIDYHLAPVFTEAVFQEETRRPVHKAELVWQRVRDHYLAEFDNVIFDAALELHIRDRQLYEKDLAINILCMSSDNLASYFDRLEAIAETQQRNLQPVDISKLIDDRERLASEIDKGEIEREAARGPGDTPPFAHFGQITEADGQRAELAQLDATIWDASLVLAPRDRQQYEDGLGMQLLLRMPGEFVEPYFDTVAALCKAQDRNLTPADIRSLIAERQKLDYEILVAGIDRLKKEQADRDYAQRDPVQEDMAWHDALARAAIEAEETRRSGQQRQEPTQEDRQQPDLAGKVLEGAGAVAEFTAQAFEMLADFLTGATPQPPQRILAEILADIEALKQRGARNLPPQEDLLGKVLEAVGPVADLGMHSFEMLAEFFGGGTPITPQRIQAAIDERKQLKRQLAKEDKIDAARFRADAEYRRQCEARAAQEIEAERQRYYEQQREREYGRDR